MGSYRRRVSPRGRDEAVDYLEAENEYVTNVMAHTKDLQSKLIEEFLHREEQENQPIPDRRGDYFYYERFDPGSEYPVYSRKKGSMEPATVSSRREILLPQYLPGSQYPLDGNSSRKHKL